MLPSVILFALLPALALAMPSPLGKRFTSRTIRSGRDGKCLSLSVTAPFPSNGAEVFTEPCSAASLWDIDEGSGSILLAAHTGFALDAGSNPQNNGGLKVWQSYPGLFQQTWYLTGDNRIAITGGNQCLDEDATNVQIYQCTTGNTNQVWYIGDA
ncbi:MAG: hypothetical protein TREMPRED_004236 [Tremellales sp. Tagirdzhanova-0007]|nr:MAG: hypothetical protein TREMPRED_004236 [Tremellales sp. Tagirdzhanova-0007]